MKITLLLLSLSFLLTACKHPESQYSEPHQTVSATDLQEHIIGSWWYDAYNPDGPVTRVTFSPDGRWSLLHTNTPSGQKRDGYWRVTPDGVLLLTKTKDALPDSNEQIFILDRLTDTEMIFGHPSMAGRMTFKKAMPNTALEPTPTAP